MTHKQWAEQKQKICKRLDELFSQFNKEVSEKKLTNYKETNELWFKKYKKRFDNLYKLLDKTLTGEFYSNPNVSRELKTINHRMAIAGKTKRKIK